MLPILQLSSNIPENRIESNGGCRDQQALFAGVDYHRCTLLRHFSAVSTRPGTPRVAEMVERVAEAKMRDIHILPCKLTYKGTALTAKYFEPTMLDSAGNGRPEKEAYFRGHKLLGKTVLVPERFKGILVESADSFDDGYDGEIEGEDLSDRFRTVGDFSKVHVWGDALRPKNDNPVIKGIEEWIAVTNAIHS